MQPKAIIITGYGINCEEETAFAFTRAGAESQIVHINDLIDDSKHLSDYQILAIPGGFSYGDDTGSGNALANRIKNNIGEKILDFIKRDTLTFGICNGFQVLVNLGLLPALGGKYGERQAALDRNDSARYQDRWVWVKNSSSKCIWAKNIDLLHVPIGHGEGKFVMPEDSLKRLRDDDQIVFTYAHEDGRPAHGVFPINPNGALMDIAGVCDVTGRVLGMMPHPDRFLHATNEDGWTLKKELLKRDDKSLSDEGEGMKIFRNGIHYFVSS